MKNNQQHHYQARSDSNLVRYNARLQNIKLGACQSKGRVRGRLNYNEHNASARGVKMITISRAQRGNSITEPTAQQEVLLVI